ncbi:MAG: right-handed parallel beta-helix repeat-containing protein [Candidatus Thorarchaeota archaeon]
MMGSIVKKVNSLLILIFLLSMSAIAINTNFMPMQMSELTNTSSRLSSYTPHGAISISGNSAFAAQGWPGDGSIEFPYIIEGLEILTDGTCISIYNTNVHFIIRNCVLSSQSNVLTNCIRFSHIHNGATENCTISDSYIGMVIIDPHNCVFVNNTLTGCDEVGILLSSSDNCTLIDNEVTDSEGYGFYVQYTENTNFVSNVIADCSRFGFYTKSTANCTFASNNLEDCGFGLAGDLQYRIHNFSDNSVNGKPFGYFLNENDTEIDGNQFGQVFLINCFNVSSSSGVFFNASIGISLFSCVNCTIRDANLNGNLQGIDLLYSENITLKDNILIDCGIRFDGNETRYWNITESGNTVNGKPFGYFLTQESLVINGDDYGQLVLVDSDHLSVVNGIFDSVTVGLVFNWCFNCSMSDALFLNDYFEGIAILNSPNCTLTNVTIEDSRDGGLSISESDNATVIESEFYGNRYGIWVLSSDHYLIDSNQIYGSHENPIYLRDTSYGMIENNLIHDNSDSLELYVVNYLEIVNNTISGSASDGLYLDFTSGVIIRDNRIYGNTGYGLNVQSFTLYSEIYNNMIGFNGAGNALDNGIYNEWDDDIGTGNIWSDYADDGLYYYISGMGVDYYPLGFLSRPDDVQYTVDEAVPAVTWNVRLPNPDSYTILWDHAVIADGSLNSSLDHLSNAIDGLSVGIYNLTLVVNDESGYSLIDTVIITVAAETTTTTTTTTTSTTATTTTTTTTSTGTTSTSTSTTTPSQPLPVDSMILIIGAVGVICVIVVLIIAIKKK